MTEKFEIERAKSLYKKRTSSILTKNGLPVKIIDWNVNPDYPICGIVKGEVYQFDAYGYCKQTSSVDLVLNVSDPKPKKNKLEKVNSKVGHHFYWHPVSEKAIELNKPVIFLTDKGCMVTHGKLKTSVKQLDGTIKEVSLFNRYATYSNAVAWVYQDELFNVEDFQKQEEIKL